MHPKLSLLLEVRRTKILSFLPRILRMSNVKGCIEFLLHYKLYNELELKLPSAKPMLRFCFKIIGQNNIIKR